LRRILVTVLAAASLIAGLAIPAAASVSPVYISGMMDPYLYQHPAHLGLWVSDSAVALHWSHWGRETASATGYVTEHSAGVWTRLPAGFSAGGIQWCGGHRVYTILSVTYGHQRARLAHFSWQDCSFSGP
jgi:hypothetical protein